jgi:5-(carboxyamino)imidazole ribonucleotide mutase
VSAPVEIRVGSDSDLPRIEAAFGVLESLGVPFEARILSAHRTPDRMAARARELERDGVRACIAAAGGSAHLPGMTASETQVPVIGVPVETRQFRGVDSLLSIVQMPEGIPVGAVGVGQAEAAARLAGRIVKASAGKPGVALTGAGGPTKEAMDLLAELGVGDAVWTETASPEELRKAGAAALIVWCGPEALGEPARHAAATELPVIAAPLASGAAPADAFVKIFAGPPVACTGMNRPRNAAIFAAQIVGTCSAPVRERLRAYREKLADEVVRKDARLVKEGVRAWLKGSPSPTPPTRP